ncbi:perlucin-like protein [Mercenaria mercenaria]|uniref:perlucin-like protein n=1 Tax=Mercenaria mercenaria TaxID=6596 RepID=UPI00234EAA11|nr:perlucin-like protein [Mercenaria mercenaria]
MVLSLIILVYFLGEAVSDTFCPDTWVADRGSCYLFNPDRASNYADARQYCSQHNGHLVVVNDVHENKFLKDFLRRLKPMGWWIGLTDELVEGEWLWYPKNEAPEYKDWVPGEPNSNGGTLDEDCASMYLDDYHHDYQWVDVHCNQIHGPICEREAGTDGNSGGGIIG